MASSMSTAIGFWRAMGPVLKFASSTPRLIAITCLATLTLYVAITYRPVPGSSRRLDLVELSRVDPVTQSKRVAACDLPNTEIVFHTIVQGLFEEGMIPRGDILDIGANNGDWSCAFACLYPGRTVHAADPSPLLKDTLPCPNQQNVRVHALAMSDQEGKISFHPAKKGDYVGNLEEKTKASDGNVEVTTLDRFFARQGSHPGFLHLDVEGYERKLILGGQKTINTYQPVFSFEVHMNTTEGRATIATVEQMGYLVFMVNEDCGNGYCRNNLALPQSASAKFDESTTLRLAVRSGVLARITSATADSIYTKLVPSARPWERHVNEQRYGNAHDLF